MACLMGISRAFYGKFGHKIELDKFMNLSCILCIVSYLTISLVPNSVVGLIGCALCGLSVGIMWPGSFSKASASIKREARHIFALLALGGDLGCTAGPTLVGFVSGRLNDNMRMGILVGTIFPILLRFRNIFVPKKKGTKQLNLFRAIFCSFIMLCPILRTLQALHHQVRHCILCCQK